MYHQYNLTGQYEFSPGWLGEVAYVGSLGRNLLVLQNIGTGNEEGGPGAREVVLVNVSNTNAITATRYIGKSELQFTAKQARETFYEGIVDSDIVHLGPCDR